jgi:hypothetical protein
MNIMGVSRRGYTLRSTREPEMTREDKRELYLRAMICKSINLEMTIEEFTRKWLPTPTGREWAAHISGTIDACEIAEDVGL